jgi:hypothetical protein
MYVCYDVINNYPVITLFDQNAGYYFFHHK